jgi:hypothetical protein
MRLDRSWRILSEMSIDSSTLDLPPTDLSEFRFPDMSALLKPSRDRAKTGIRIRPRVAVLIEEFDRRILGALPEIGCQRMEVHVCRLWLRYHV